MSRIRCAVLLIVALLVTPALSPVVGAQQAEPDTGRTADDQLVQRLVQEITRQVLEELRKGDFLQEQIRLGIEAYVRDQQAAQAAARAEQARLANERARGVRPPSRDRDHIYGDPDAPISLIAYSDFECPFCKAFHATPRAVVDAYPGQVNWVYRHLPLPMHAPGAELEAEAAECAAELGGNEAFWAYADAIYARTTSNGTGFPQAGLAPLAAEIGLNREPFQVCLNEDRHADRIRGDATEAFALGVNSTPTVIVRQNRTGDVRIRAGALPMEVYTADIEAMLAP